MRVAELRLILDMVDPDDLVFVATGNCCHVNYVRRDGNRRGIPLDVHDDVGPAVVLRGDGMGDRRLWFQEEPTWRMSGRWRLSKLSPEGRQLLQVDP